MIEFVAGSAEEMQEFALKVAKKLSPGTVLLFFGDLGAGKTTFIKGLSAAFDVDPEEVSSPTYAYLHEHVGSLPFFHFDLYRLSGAEDFIAMGFDEVFERGGIVCIEWSEKILPILPKNAVLIEIEHLSETERKVTIKGLKDEVGI